MSISSKSSNAVKKDLDREEIEFQAPEIIPWPDIQSVTEKEKSREESVRLDQKFLYYKGRKIPILQFQKSGYDKLLKLLVKEIGG